MEEDDDEEGDLGAGGNAETCTNEHRGIVSSGIFGKLATECRIGP